ncbi:MAG: ECF-type sigma factor [Phycisphaerales bacterium]
MLLYYGGLTQQQAAELLGVSTRTVERDWRFAKAWLQRELGPEQARGNGDLTTAPSATAHLFEALIDLDPAERACREPSRFVPTTSP